MLLKAHGEVDLATAADFSGALQEAFSGGRPAVVVDLAGVHFMGSEGLSSLLNALRRLTRARRRLVLVVPDGPVLHLLRTTRMVGTFEVHPTLRSALRAL